MTDSEWQRLHLIYERMVRAIMNCPIPTIGAINGAAYGGGCELAAAMDFAYASDHARFAMTETSLGIIPGAGGTQNLSTTATDADTGDTTVTVQQSSWTDIDSYTTTITNSTAVTGVASGAADSSCTRQ